MPETLLAPDSWINLSIDFVVNLLESKEYNIIIIYIDYLIKLRHFILIINKIITQSTVRLFIENIYKHYKFPKIIISDRGL